MNILDFTQLDGRSVLDWMNDRGEYDAFRVPPGIVLTKAQFGEYLRARGESAEAADRYALAVGQQVSREDTGAATAIRTLSPKEQGDLRSSMKEADVYFKERFKRV